MKVAVIGFGPSGWAATHRLAELGHDVTVFATGLDDSNSKSKLGTKKKINSKLLHGSDYPYREFPHGPKIVQNDVNLQNSFATFGLSLVWGATMQPYKASDFVDWPLKIEDLENSYSEIAKRVPIAGKPIDFGAGYSPHSNYSPLIPSGRIVRFLEKVNESDLENFYAEASRLAIYTQNSTVSGCNYCNKCLEGCPIDKIWHSSHIDINNVKFESNIRVIKIHEEEETISIEGLDIKEKKYTFSGFKKVFIGAGNIETFRILSTSGYVNNSVLLRDSSTFFVPLLLSMKYGVAQKSNYALSQAFVTLKKSSIRDSHFQIYDYSEDLINRAKGILPLGKYIPNFILRIPLSRLFVAIGYLHSSDSPLIQMKLLPSGDVELNSVGDSVDNSKKLIRNVVRELHRKIRSAGLFPISGLIKFSLPGEGVHSGGWLPMGEKSDLLGRPVGLHNVHVVDSSTFPTIPAGPITFTLMANANRIVSESVK